MIINEYQILQLIRLADGYSIMLHKFGEYKELDAIQNLLAKITLQQSKELKDIKDDNQ